MKSKLILTLALSAFAAGAFAEDGFDRTGAQRFAEDGFDRTHAHRIS